MRIDLNTLHREEDHFVANSISGHAIPVTCDFPIEEWCDASVFKKAKIVGYEPMTAKELETEDVQDARLNDANNYFEEKFDGTRALVYFLENERGGYCRVFSRRISKKTGFYVENTDSLPQLKLIDEPEMAGTILDGEMFINGLPFKEVSSTLNCLWDKAIDRQIEKGFITFHAFDILFYHGIDLRKMPLHRRKVYLHLAVEEAGSDYIEEVKYYDCNTVKGLDFSYELLTRISPFDEDWYLSDLETDKDKYPNLYAWWKNNYTFNPRAYYELIVSTGGEGLIVKPKNGRYLHKRGWEYSKIKKFLTRDLIVTGFSEPTKEYTGKEIKKWTYWVHKDTDVRKLGNFYGDKNYIPVTKYYFYNQVGVMRLGVLITSEEYEAMKPNKRGVIINYFNKYVMEVCECGGFDDETRQYFTDNKDKLIGSVVEVKANELFRDSGKMRHPRYMRMRFDKEPERCIWRDHIGDSEVTK